MIKGRRSKAKAVEVKAGTASDHSLSYVCTQDFFKWLLEVKLGF